MRRFFVLVVLFFLGGVLASDVSVFQGQYFVDDEFQQGTFDFRFDVYNNETGGDLIYSYEENLTTGRWGQWKVELVGLSAAADDSTKDYFVEILVDGVVQDERERITHFNFLRKDVNEVTDGTIEAGGFTSGADEKGRSFLDVLGNDVAYFVSGGDFLGVEDVTQFYLTRANSSNGNGSHLRDDGRKGVGFSLLPFSGDSDIGYLWANIHGGTGGFFMFDTHNKSSDVDFRQVGAFTDRRLSLGHDGSTPVEGLKSEGSAGMDFVIFSDAEGGLAFYVNSSGDYETTINADLNVTGGAYFSDVSIDGRGVCLSDGTNCLFGSSGNLTEQDPYWNFDKFNYYTKTEVDEKVDSVSVSDVLVLKPSDIPEDPEEGTIYFDEDDSELRFYDGSNWYEINMKKISGLTVASRTASRVVESSAAEEEVVQDVQENISVSDDDVCDEVCSEEEVCAPVETCEEICEGEGEDQSCSEVCSEEEVCEDVETCEEVCGIPEQLFDIGFVLDSNIVEDSSDLLGVVNFESFGSIPTEVNLTFSILEDGKRVYSKKIHEMVFTEKVYIWSYGGETLPEGDYVVRLETLYDVDVYDIFEQAFEIRYSFWRKVLDVFDGF